MEALILIVGGIGIGIIRISFAKRNKTSQKIRYTNYSKYVVKNKKYNNSINEQSKF